MLDEVAWMYLSTPRSSIPLSLISVARVFSADGLHLPAEVDYFLRVSAKRYALCDPAANNRAIPLSVAIPSKAISSGDQRDNTKASAGR